jgi:hypothetical protein
MGKSVRETKVLKAVRASRLSPTLDGLSKWFASMGAGEAIVSPGEPPGDWNTSMQRPPSWRLVWLWEFADNIHDVLSDAEIAMVDRNVRVRAIGRDCDSTARMVCKEIAARLRTKGRAFDSESISLLCLVATAASLHGGITQEAWKRYARTGWRSEENRKEAAADRRKAVPGDAGRRVALKLSRNRHLSRTEAQRQVAADVGVSLRTLLRRLSEQEKGNHGSV